MAQPDTGTSPQFTLASDVQPDLTIVRCSGRLTLQSGDMLRAEVRKWIQPGGRVVLDLTNVTHCDSMGLGAIVSLYVSSKSEGCRLELIHLGPTIRRLFSMTNLLSLFEAAAESNCRIP